MIRVTSLVCVSIALFACATTDKSEETSNPATGGASASGGTSGASGEAGASGASGVGGAPTEPTGCGPTGGSTTGPHAYFYKLTARPECVEAYSLRSQAELDSIETAAKSDRKYPVTYDPAMDAALFKIDPSAADGSGGGSTDSQQKRVPIEIKDGSMLLTWDFRFDSGFQWVSDGDLALHKTWRVDVADGVYLALKTNYAFGAKTGLGLAEGFMSAQSNTWLAPGTTSEDSEILKPRLAQFYIQANTWTRYWLAIESIGGGVDGTPSRVSLWAADEQHDPIQLYSELALFTPTDGFKKFLFEYDTSQDAATNTEMRSWNRNWVMLKNVADIPSLLERPAP